MATVESMGTQRITSISEATIMLECFNCIRLIINSHVGLEIILQKHQYAKTLIQGELIPDAKVEKRTEMFRNASKLSIYCFKEVQFI